MDAVFYPAFHESMPAEAYLYGLTYDYYQKYKLRSYVFQRTYHLIGYIKEAELT